MSSEWCVLWLSVKVTLHVNMLTMLRDLKKVLHGITCHGHMAPVGLFHFEEMVNIVNMKGHRAGLTSVKLHVSMTRADVALGALNWVVTHTNTQSRTMRLPRGYENPSRDQSISSTSTRWSTQSAWPERQVVSRAGWAASTGTRLQAGCRAERVTQV